MIRARQTRRGFLATVGAALALPRWRALSPPPPFRVRTITAGVSLQGPTDLRPVDAALAALGRCRQRFQDAGYEVQTIRVATAPFTDLGAVAGFRRLDEVVAARGAILSIGPVPPGPGVASWAADLVQAASRTSFSMSVASAEGGVDRDATVAAANVIAGLAKAAPGGIANFRFAAAARVPAGTPFFPVAYHRGADSLAVGLETPRVVREAVGGASGDPGLAQERVRRALTDALQPVARLGAECARAERRAFLGIDPSPAPGMDASIGEAIETLTGAPFGGPSTLAACAAVTGALKSLEVATCGYAGLMLPVLEDPVLARRAAEGRFGLDDLLLYSAVCGTGLDVVPLPGDAPPQSLAKVIGDVAVLATRLEKPLSARLFPIPGKRAGDVAEFNDPFLTSSVVLALD